MSYPNSRKAVVAWLKSVSTITSLVPVTRIGDRLVEGADPVPAIAVRRVGGSLERTTSEGGFSDRPVFQIDVYGGVLSDGRTPDMGKAWDIVLEIQKATDALLPASTASGTVRDLTVFQAREIHPSEGGPEDPETMTGWAKIALMVSGVVYGPGLAP